MPRRRYPSKLPSRELDSGALRVSGIHIGDGYYEVTCECDVCGDEATKTATITKDMYKGVGDRWFREHWHNP